MKKLVFMFVAVAAISFASCGNQTKPAEANGDSINEVVEVNDSDSIQNSGDSLNVVNDSTNAQ